MSTLYALRAGFLLAACLAAATANAASPREDFESDKLVLSAGAEIANLNADQLTAVIDYIANCSPTPAPERDFWCERANQIADIKTAQARSFARIRQSLFVIDKVIPWKRSGVGEREAKDIERRVKIFRDLGRAAAEAYERLNTQSGSR